MKRLRVLLGAMLAVALAAVALPAHASDGDPGLPAGSTWTDASCGGAAAAAGPDQCDVRPMASAGSGAVSITNRLVSPVGGTAAWNARSSGTSDVVATYHLAEPVPELAFTITIHVNEARVALGVGAPTPGAQYYDYQLNRSARVYAGAMALHSACPGSECGGGTSLIVVSSSKPGTTVTTSGKDVVVSLKVSRQDGEALPPGDLTVRAGVGTSVSQLNGWGDDSASVDAVVEKISVS